MWAHAINALLGLWLMAAPAVLGYGAPAASNDRIIGPIAASIAIIAFSEATRPMRWVNLPLGLWLLIAPWALGYPEAVAWLNSFAVGTLMALLAAVRGPIKERLGGGWRSLWQAEEEHQSMQAK